MRTSSHPARTLGVLVRVWPSFFVVPALLQTTFPRSDVIYYSLSTAGFIRLPDPQQPRYVWLVHSSGTLIYATLGTVRKLNSVLFPIKYSEKFYHDIVQPELEEFCKLGMYTLRVLTPCRSAYDRCPSKFTTMMYQ